MDSEQLNIYLDSVKALAARNSNDAEALKASMMQLINDHMAAVDENSAEAEFFQGEKQFYSENYEEALKHYVETKKIPLCLFFCYRASSFMSHARGQNDLALTFAQKALPLYSEDHALQNLLNKLTAQASPETNQQAVYATPETNLVDEAQKFADFFDANDDNPEELFSHQQPNLHTTSQAIHGKQENSSISMMESHEEPSHYSMEATADIFAPSMSRGKTLDPLTERLHTSGSAKTLPSSPYSTREPKMSTEQKVMSTEQKALQELRKLAIADQAQETYFPLTSVNSDDNQELEKRISLFQNSQAIMAQAYLKQVESRPQLLDSCLYTLNGWTFTPSVSNDPAHFLFTEESRKSQGGHYLRWNGNGIAINPGAEFVTHLHQQGLSVRDIDFVIVTRANLEAYADVKTIYELNNQLNKSTADVHVIHYYLHHKTYRDLSTILKPTSKLARHTIHNLEMFADSAEVEKIEINKDIILHYFLASPQETFNQHYASQHQAALNASSLGIRLELQRSNQDRNSLEQPFHLGYISGMKWTPLIAHYLGRCDLLLASFGNTSHSDYSKLSYNENCLGYHGTYSLLEEVAPRLLLLTEFSGREGDIRLEATKKLRLESNSNNRLANYPTTTLPADLGLLIDLKTLQIKCSISDSFMPLTQVHVVASAASFGRLQYISPQYCI